MNGTSERQTLDLGVPPAVVRVSASGGKIEITPFELGHMEPAPPVQ